MHPRFPYSRNPAARRYAASHRESIASCLAQSPRDALNVFQFSHAATH
jgi:hypothetical protein